MPFISPLQRKANILEFISVAHGIHSWAWLVIALLLQYSESARRRGTQQQGSGDRWSPEALFWPASLDWLVGAKSQ